MEIPEITNAEQNVQEVSKTPRFISEILSEQPNAVAIFGISGNPPSIAHREMALQLRNIGFKKVYIPLSGMRHDKPDLKGIDPKHRINMARINFAGIDGVHVVINDIEYERFSTAYELDQMYRKMGFTPWHIFGWDILQGGKQSQLYQDWHQGKEFWSSANILPFKRVGYEFDLSDLPPNTAYPISFNFSTASRDIRKLASIRIPLREHVTPEVAQYIQTHNLYIPEKRTYPLVVLASKSNDRQEVLREAIEHFGVVPSNIDESTCLEQRAVPRVRELARQKALSVADDLQRQGDKALVIGADTIVAKRTFRGKMFVFEKPKNREEAKQMINHQNGGESLVYTGMCLIAPSEENSDINTIEDSRIFEEVCEARVKFRKLLNAEVDEYLNTIVKGKPIWEGNSGALSINGRGGFYIESAGGDFYAIRGLSLSTLHQLLNRAGYPLPPAPAKDVQLWQHVGE